MPATFLASAYGAVTGAGASQTAAINSAINAAEAAGGGFVQFDAGSFRCDTDIILKNNVELVGAPGTILDFSARATFANGATSGLIQAKGTIEATRALTARVYERPGAFIRLSGATRSGTVVTADTYHPHGFLVGDLIWVMCQQNTDAAQQNFFSTPVLSGFQGRLTPHKVASVPTTTRFTYTVANTGPTTMSVVGWVIPADDVLEIASTTGYAPNDLLRIGSNDTRTTLSETVKIGELNYVKLVLSSTLVWLRMPVRDSYLVTSGAAVGKITPLRNVAVRNIEIVGKGNNSATTGLHYGDRGIYFERCDGFEVERCRIRNVDMSGICFRESINGAIQSNRISFSATDEGARTTGVIDIQYGICPDMGSQSVEISNNTITNGRHGVVQTSTATAGYFGISRDINITGNHFYNCWLAAISSHQGVERWQIINNTITGGEGISIRYCKELSIKGNRTTGCTFGVHLYRYVNGATISDNEFLRCGMFGVRVDTIDSSAGLDNLIIKDNRITDSEIGIYVYQASSDSFPKNIVVDQNNITGSSYIGIQIQIGTALGGGWRGSCRNNRLINPVRWPFGTGVRAVNAINVRFDGTVINQTGPGMSYGVYATGPQTVNCFFEDCDITGHTLQAVAIAA